LAEIQLATLKKPKSQTAEAYRTLRTNIQFSSLDNKVKTIVITSSGPAEGKTTTACNLAITMAQAGSKIILLDCDTRIPKIHKVFEVSNQAGLSNLLIDEIDTKKAIHKTEVENLFVLTSGTKPPNPADLLGADKMRRLIEVLKETYDYIIIDTPPIVAVTDAQVLSKYADGCLLVIASAEVDKDAAIKAKELLETVNAKILGVVLNKLDTKRKGYYGYNYHSYYGKEVSKHLKKEKKSIFGKQKVKSAENTKTI
jgi:capsular exopolysaccharide synthesis family protein